MCVCHAECVCQHKLTSQYAQKQLSTLYIEKDVWHWQEKIRRLTKERENTGT